MRINWDSLKNRRYEIRIIEKFLWFPKCINKETRWLEKTKIKQQVQQPINYDYCCWVDIEWMD